VFEDGVESDGFLVFIPLAFSILVLRELNLRFHSIIFEKEFAFLRFLRRGRKALLKTGKEQN
jgi:hypothetical protein